MTPADTGDACFELGVRHLTQGENAAAIACFRRALLLDPTLAEAHANLAFLLERTPGEGAAVAETHYRAALALMPGHPRILLNFGILLAGQKRFAEAESLHRRALAADPSDAGTWSALGVLLACAQREDEAEQCYRQAMAQDPEYRLAPFNLAYLLLRQGRYAEGWACFDARNWHDALERELAFPRWRGEGGVEALAGKRLLLTPEGGHGDMIQFCRYSRQLKAAGVAHLGILCHPGLAPLLQTLAGVDSVIPCLLPLTLEGWDYWTPPMSLPRHFGTRLDNIPATLPYLWADPERQAAWTERLGPRCRPPRNSPRGRRIGLAWRGNPNFENDADRSLPGLHTLAPLGACPGIEWFSLQKGPGEDEARTTPPFPLRELGSQFADFADTAAAIMNLDLVITVDTAIAHLTGALGKPCWVLLPDYKTDWRWLTEREDSPWYPGVMRLFRQKTPGDWTAAVDAVQQALLAEAPPLRA